MRKHFDLASLKLCEGKQAQWPRCKDRTCTQVRSRTLYRAFFISLEGKVTAACSLSIIYAPGMIARLTEHAMEDHPCSSWFSTLSIVPVPMRRSPSKNSNVCPAYRLFANLSFTTRVISASVESPG